MLGAMNLTWRICYNYSLIMFSKTVLKITEYLFIMFHKLGSALVRLSKYRVHFDSTSN